MNLCILCHGPPLLEESQPVNWDELSDVLGLTIRSLYPSRWSGQKSAISSKKEAFDSGGKPGTVVLGKTGLQESSRLPKRKRIRMTICTYNAHVLASEAVIEDDLMMQAGKIKCDVIGLTMRDDATQ
ncbi:hypothetical protein RB195_022244 [Necator americanus]|uniref:Uncharacterized protein n=1 Tax=Necator americanus TaxID=51031 RepID=A0ABR1EF74_NECAM